MNTFETAPSRTLRRLSTLIFPLALASLSGAAVADDESPKIFSVSGFGTLGMTHSNENNGDYVNGTTQPTGTGYSKGWTPSVDSLLAAQVDARLNDNWSAVVQVISALNADGNYKPHLEWANIKYAFSPDLSVRVGRIALPTFLVSDTRLVGYANTWVRAPVETYSLYSITKSDGVDGSWSHSIGGFKHTVQAWYGRTKLDSVNNNGLITRDITLDNLRGIANTLEKGALTVRLGAQFSNLKFFSPAVKRDYNLSNKTYNLGAIYDPGTWFVQGEYSYTARALVAPIATATGSERAINALAGYRLDKFTPYVLFSRVGTPSAVWASREQRTSAVGVRWDVYKNIDVKLQYENIQLGSKSNGFFANVKPGLAGSNNKLATLAVDFIY